MSRLNIYQLHKWDELPFRISNKTFVNWNEKRCPRHWRHEDWKFYRKLKHHIKKCLGNNWTEISNPRNHPINYWKPKQIVQHRINKLWYLRHYDGDFLGYGYESPRKLYLSLDHGEYVIDPHGIVLKGKKKRRYYITKYDISKDRKKKRQERLVKYLTSIADFEIIIKESYDKIRFFHPIIESYVSTDLENAIATFKKHNKTYFINYLGKYYTNLKWSFKQNASNM
jgi:hypothetical protein